MFKKGLSKYQIEMILLEKIESDPDLKYYIDNDYVSKLVGLLIEGISEVIEENNNKLLDDIYRR